MHLVNEVFQDIEAEGHIYLITLDQQWFTANTVYEQNHRLLKISALWDLRNQSIGHTDECRSS